MTNVTIAALYEVESIYPLVEFMGAGDNVDDDDVDNDASVVEKDAIRFHRIK